MPTKKAAPAAAAAETTTKPSANLDAQGNEMNMMYFIRQYVGLGLALVAFACVCFAGYAPQFPELFAKGVTVNFYLYSGASGRDVQGTHPYAFPSRGGHPTRVYYLSRTRSRIPHARQMRFDIFARFVRAPTAEPHRPLY